MKKILLSFIFFAIILDVACGQNLELWGISQSGAGTCCGTIFKIKADGTSFQRVCSLDSVYGAAPYSLFQASDGMLYGTTDVNMPNGFGALFSYDVVSNTLSLRHQFATASYHPSGKIIETSTHKIYGMTEYGGTSGNGTIFSFDPLSNNYLDIYSFDGLTGARPSVCGLSNYINGDFFAATTFGGTNSTGVIFSFDTTGNTYSKLFDFDAGSGAGPVGTLTLAGNGLYYGKTEFGSNIFSFDPSNNIFTNLFNLGGLNGQSPTAGLLYGSDGLLYGMTAAGGVNDSGIIFSYDPANGLFTKRYDFGGLNGTYPLGELMQASNGKIYGMTCFGGVYNSGVIFCYDPASTNYNKIFDFNGVNIQGSFSCLFELDSSLINRVSDIIPKSAVTIVPNPTSGKLTVSSKHFPINQIDIYNMVGEKVFSVSESGLTTVDCTLLSPGIYILQATSGEKTWRTKVVKE